METIFLHNFKSHKNRAVGLHKTARHFQLNDQNAFISAIKCFVQYQILLPRSLRQATSHALALQPRCTHPDFPHRFCSSVSFAVFPSLAVLSYTALPQHRWHIAVCCTPQCSLLFTCIASFSATQLNVLFAQKLLADQIPC